MKKISLAILTAITAFAIISVPSASPSFAFTDNNLFSIYVNGKAIKFTDAKPFIDNESRTMLPLRAVGDGMGATVSWNEKTQSAKIELGNKKIELPIGKSYGLVNGVKVDFDTMTITSKGRTYVPLRFVSESLDFKVEYRFGQDRSVGEGRYHIININSDNNKSQTLVDKGFGAVMPLEDSEHPEKFFPNIKDPVRQIRMISNSLHFEGDGTETNTFEPDISVWYSSKGLITVDISRYPNQSDYFLKQSLNYMMGTDGTEIATQLVKMINSVKEGDTYKTNSLMGKSFSVNKYKITWKTDREIQITFNEK